MLAGELLLQEDRAYPIEQAAQQAQADRFPGEPRGVPSEQWDEHAEGGEAEQEASLRAGQSGQAR